MSPGTGFRFLNRRRWLLPGMALVAFGAMIASGNAATLTVTNTNDSGPGSLRQALLNANSAPDDDTVVFDLPAGAERVIRLTTNGVTASKNVMVLNDRPGDLPITIEAVVTGAGLYSCLATQLQ